MGLQLKENNFLDFDVYTVNTHFTLKKGHKEAWFRRAIQLTNNLLVGTGTRKPRENIVD